MERALKPTSAKRYRRSCVISAAILMVLAAVSICALAFRLAFPRRARAFMTDVFGTAPGFAIPGQTPPPLPVPEAHKPGNSA